MPPVTGLLVELNAERKKERFTKKSNRDRNRNQSPEWDVTPLQGNGIHEMLAVAADPNKVEAEHLSFVELYVQFVLCSWRAVRPMVQRQTYSFNPPPPSKPHLGARKVRSPEGW